MKFLIPLFCCYVLCTKTAVGQRYVDRKDNFYFVCFDSTKEDSFPDMIPFNGEIIPVWPTSAQQLNDSTWQFELFKYIDFFNPADSFQMCFPQNIPGIIGHRIVESPQTLTFFNSRYEPIVLNLQTAIDSSWIGFQNDSVWMVTTRLADTTISLLDSTYTINRFRWTAFFADSTPNSQNKYDGQIIEIAVGLGVVSTPPLYDFPYDTAFSRIQLSGVLNLQKRTHLGVTIFPKPQNRFDIGDEFHTYREFAGPGREIASGTGDREWRRDLVYGKQQRKDTTIYTCVSTYKRNKWLSVSGHPELSYDSSFYFQDTPVYTYVPVLPDSGSVDYKNKLILHSFYPYSHRFQTVGFFRNNFFYYYHRSDSLWCMAEALDDYSYRQFFSIGIPDHHSYFRSPGIGHAKSKLVYAKRKGQTWGTPYPARVGIQEWSPAPFEVETKLYPNPAQTVLTVSIPETAASIESIDLYDTMGKRYTPQTHALHPRVVDVSPFPAGMYWVVVHLTNGQNSSAKLVIHHD